MKLLGVQLLVLCGDWLHFNNFLECNMGSGDTIRSYTNRLSGYIDELSKMGKPLDELYVCYQLLRKIPEKFQFVIQCLLQLPDKQFKFKNLKNLLLSKETRQFLHEKELSSASGPIVQEVRRTCKSPVACSNGKSREGKNFLCFQCNMPGHYGGYYSLDVELMLCRSCFL